MEKQTAAYANHSDKSHRCNTEDIDTLGLFEHKLKILSKRILGGRIKAWDMP